ncbi:hypothetical protein [Chitiniphilus eburneus]|uniref:hypothetical protein n=1 Tax=Chitiniphilus eburneus TaxID=2571148 RepID=UPI0035CEB078
MFACRRWFLLLLIALLPIQGMAAFAMPWRSAEPPTQQTEMSAHCDDGTATRGHPSEQGSGGKHQSSHGACFDCGHCAACFPPLATLPPPTRPCPACRRCRRHNA